MTTFTEAPLQSRKVEFPDSGFRLGFPREAFPRRAKLKRSLAFTPTHSGLPRTRPCKTWLLRLSPLTILGPPSAQSSFARHERYSCQDGVQHHLEGHYPFFLAPTSSCVKPAPSSDFVIPHLFPRSLQVAASPCWERILPTLFRESFPGCLSHTPAGPLVHLPVSSPVSSAFPKRLGGSASRLSAKRFFAG